MATFMITANTWGVDATAQVPTLAEAEAIAATFPKAAKVHASTLGTYLQDEHGQPIPGPDGRRYQNITLGLVNFQATLKSNKVNGGQNETGIRRYHSFRRTAERLGHKVIYGPAHPNGPAPRELLERITGWTD